MQITRKIPIILKNVIDEKFPRIVFFLCEFIFKNTCPLKHTHIPPTLQIHSAGWREFQVCSADALCIMHYIICIIERMHYIISKVDPIHQSPNPARSEMTRPDRNAFWRLIYWKVYKIGTSNFNIIFNQVFNLYYQNLGSIYLII